MKKRTGKRLLSLFLSLVMIFGMFPASVFATGGLGSVQVIVENTTYTTDEGAAWDGTLVDATVDLAEDSTMMSCIGEALSGHTVEGLDSGYITEINGLAAFDGGTESGWMGTLNDWFTDVGFGDITVENGKLCAGDEIRVMYSCTGYGADLGGAFGTNQGYLSSLSASSGALSPDFDKETTAYSLTVDANVTTVDITAAAENKNDKVTVKVDETTYRRGVNVPVEDGTVISIACGEKTYTVTVEQEAAAPDTYVVTLPTGDGTFAPDATMTRAEFAVIVVRALGLEGKTADAFTDVPAGQWYAPYVGTASTYGVISGVGGGRFNPYGAITRQEAASMVARAARLCGMDTGLGEVEIRNTLAQFGDYVTVAAWAKESVAFCYRADILDQSDLEVAPTAAIRRGEIAQMLYNLLSSAKLL